MFLCDLNSNCISSSTPKIQCSSTPNRTCFHMVLQMVFYLLSGMHCLSSTLALLSPISPVGTFIGVRIGMPDSYRTPAVDTWLPRGLVLLTSNWLPMRNRLSRWGESWALGSRHPVALPLRCIHPQWPQRRIEDWLELLVDVVIVIWRLGFWFRGFWRELGRQRNRWGLKG